MSAYLKDNFEFDFGLFKSRLTMIFSRISSMIDKFSDCLAEDEEQKHEEIEIIEDYGSVKIPEDLAKSLTEFDENLKNQVFYNSIAIAVYSFLEFSLIEYCRLIDLYIKPQKSFYDYRIYGLDKIKYYLKDNFKIDFGKIKNWEEIKLFQKVRNIIVHNNANLIKDISKPLNDQEDYSEISKLEESIEITSAGYIFIKDIDYLIDIKNKSIEMINDIIDKTSTAIGKSSD